MARPRYGYRRLWVLLRREGWNVNHKRVLRIYQQEELLVRTKTRRKLASHLRVVPPPAQRPNERWGLDFMHDTLADGRRFRVLTVMDLCTRECLALAAASNFPVSRVIDVLEPVVATRGSPSMVTVDNGTEFTSRRFDAWATDHGVKIDFIRPGHPVENAFIESFNGRVREECLNLHWFRSIEEATRKLAAWRQDYNEVRPHSSLDNLAPREYVARLLVAQEATR